MIKVIAGPARSRIPSLIAALVVATLGVAAFVAISPQSATAGSCPRGEVCLYPEKGFIGGPYHFAGNDSDLRNDRYESSFFGKRVANDTESVWNHGRPDPSGLVDVALFSRPRYRGDAVCVKLDQGGDLPIRFLNTIESYRWVTRAACNALPSGLGK